MRVLVNAEALEALCAAAEGKYRREVSAVRATVRSEPAAEATAKVATYEEIIVAPEPEPEACTFAPRRRSAVI